MEKLETKSSNKNSQLKKYLIFTFYAAIIAFATNYLIIYIEIYSTGLSGISQGIAYTINDFVLENPSESNKLIIYWGIYAFSNIPIYFFAKRKFGKSFTYSSLYVLFATICISFFFSYTPGFKDLSFFPKDELEQANQLETFIIYGFIGFISGVLIGYAIGNIFNNNSSSLGLDPIVRNLSRKKQINVGKIILIIALINAILWTLLSEFLSDNVNSFADFLNVFFSPVVFGSLVYYLTNSIIISKLYSSTKKIMIQINTNKSDEISYYLNSLNYHRNHTTAKVKGGYSSKERWILSTIINKEEFEDVLTLINKIDDKAFIYTIDVDNIVGNFDSRPLTFEDKFLEEKYNKNKKNKKPNDKSLQSYENTKVNDTKETNVNEGEIENKSAIKYKITSDGIYIYNYEEINNKQKEHKVVELNEVIIYETKEDNLITTTKKIIK